MADKQTLIAEPPAGMRVAAQRLRRVGDETLETQPISDILLKEHGRNSEYMVRTQSGLSYRMDNVGQNPKYLVLYNGEALATCGVNYVPLFNSELKQCVLDALTAIDRSPLSISEEDCGRFSYRMTALLNRDFEIPVGHFKTSEKFNWGISLTNSYDLKTGVHLYLYIYRQVCENGMYGWSLGGKRNFLHVEKEQDPETILAKVTEGVGTIVEEHGLFFKRLEEMSTAPVSPSQAQLVLKRLGIRKYEAALLADHGLLSTFKGTEVDSVSFETRMNTEYDLMNALTAISKDTNTTSRMLEIQTGLMEKILMARATVPRM